MKRFFASHVMAVSPRLRCASWVCILRPVGPKQSGKAGWGLLVGADLCGGRCCWSPPHSEIEKMQRLTKWRDFVGQ